MSLPCTIPFLPPPKVIFVWKLFLYPCYTSTTCTYRLKTIYNTILFNATRYRNSVIIYASFCSFSPFYIVCGLSMELHCGTVLFFSNPVSCLMKSWYHNLFHHSPVRKYWCSSTFSLHKQGCSDNLVSISLCTCTWSSREQS